MRIALVILALGLALVPTALAAEYEHTVYLHEYSAGLHIVPEQINAKVGDTLKLTVVNQGASPHNFLVCGDGEDFDEACSDRWGFTGMIEPNATAPVTVEVKEAGRFDYYCYVPGHKGAGMAGTLVVSGGAQEKSSVPLGPIALAALGAAALALRRIRA